MRARERGLLDRNDTGPTVGMYDHRGHRPYDREALPGRYRLQRRELRLPHSGCEIFATLSAVTIAWGSSQLPIVQAAEANAHDNLVLPSSGTTRHQSADVSHR